MDNNPGRRLALVWGDTVALKELFIASIIGIVLTLGGYIIGRNFFRGMENLEPGLANGYALMVGIIGCVLAGVISAVLFKPKRIIEEKFEQEDIAEVLKADGMTVEEEAAYLATVDPQILEELKDLNLTALLELREKGKVSADKGAKKGGEMNVNS